MKKEDIAPPYTAVTQHDVFPKPKHDEVARFNFLANFNRFMATALGPGNKRAFDSRVLPKFLKDHGNATLWRCDNKMVGPLCCARSKS